MSREIGLPDRVLTIMRANGAHNDCIVAGPDSATGACEPCVVIITAAMDEVYGHLATENELVAEIIIDLLMERKQPDGVVE